MNSRISRVAVPLGVVGIILLLVVPVPALMLDLLIICNILLALVILLTTMFVKRPLDFSAFPSLLLVATLFRLSLNVASTRLVLGDGFAGQVIEAMGHVVVGGSLIIGLVIFLILVVIQFVVITKGSERVAEVGARFTLDAMPGKQMAIDADLNAGAITEDQARARRADVSAEADFYGAMDGASKFVKGDAIAGIIITIINLVGGMAMGMLMRGMEPMDAVNTYSILTIGDGLVTQIPALLMAVATGMIVTRSGAEEEMGSTASAQLSQSRQALMIAGCAAMVMALIPGMPKLPFVLIGALLLIAAQRIKTSEAQADAEKLAAEAAEKAGPVRTETTEDLIKEMRVHALEIRLSTDLVSLVSGSQDDLLGRVRSLRRKIASDLGVVVPPVRTRDDITLPPGTYSVHIAGVEAGRGQAPGGKVLALGEALSALPGQPVVEPVFGLPGKWIPAEMRHSAEMTGATVIDRVSVLVTHLSSIITNNAARLLSREDVRVLTEGVKEISPSAVDELTPAVLSLAELQQVLQGLLAEQVPINDLSRIYEALVLPAKNPQAGVGWAGHLEALVEAARGALGPVLVHQHAVDGKLRVLTIAPSLEMAMLEKMRPSELGTQVIIDPARVETLMASLARQVEAAQASGLPVVLVCAPKLRPPVRRMVAQQISGLPVLSYAEATSADVLVETVGVVTDAQAIAA